MNGARIASLPALVIVAAGMVMTPTVCSAQNEISYMLLEGSTLTDDCPACMRPTIIVPLGGRLVLSLREENPLFTTYDVREIGFQAPPGGTEYGITGAGTYEIGGEVALVQRMRLKVQIGDLGHFELVSDTAPLGRVWPTIEIEVTQEPFNPTRLFRVHLIAAPVREIWFSTSSQFTSATLGQPVSPGDLLSYSGRVVKRNSDLVGRLGIMPAVPDLGLDALDVVSGGEVVFSTEEDVHSETLGPLQHGDLLSDNSRIVRTNQQLTSAFVPKPPAKDMGLDAVQVKEDGEILFSVEEDFFSESLGVWVRRGDLLSDKGVIVLTNEKLLANFEPLEGQGDVGLDAVHVWPSGEIWFSTEVGFQSRTVGTVLDGDLLSTGDVLSGRGTLLFRNLQLLDPFAPLEDAVNFGLDSLFLVTEGHLTLSSVHHVRLMFGHAGDIQITWLSNGKVFRLERADEPGGPYFSLGPIMPGMTWVDPEASLEKKKSFYRIGEW